MLKTIDHLKNIIHIHTISYIFNDDNDGYNIEYMYGHTDLNYIGMRYYSTFNLLELYDYRLHKAYIDSPLNMKDDYKIYLENKYKIKIDSIE